MPMLTANVVILLAEPGGSLQLAMVLDEAVLLRMVGNPEVMYMELRHVATMAQRGNVDLRIMPLSTPA